MSDDININTNPNDTAEITPTPEQIEARRAELGAILQGAEAAALHTALETQAALHKLRDTEWIGTAATHDAQTWLAVAEAVGNLPAHATHQQIALAQAQAIAVAKANQADACAAAVPELRAAAAGAIETYEAKEREVKVAREAVAELDPLTKWTKKAPLYAGAGVLAAAWAFGLGKIKG